MHAYFKLIRGICLSNENCQFFVKCEHVFQEYCAAQGTTISGVYAKGCFTLVVEQIQNHEAIIGSVAIVVAAVMVRVFSDPIPIFFVCLFLP